MILILNDNDEGYKFWTDLSSHLMRGLINRNPCLKGNSCFLMILPDIPSSFILCNLVSRLHHILFWYHPAAINKLYFISCEIFHARPWSSFRSPCQFFTKPRHIPTKIRGEYPPPPPPGAQICEVCVQFVLYMYTDS